MSQEFILAAINRQQLEDVCQITARQKVVVLGTMDGRLLKQVNVSSSKSALSVYFYEPG